MATSPSKHIPRKRFGQNFLTDRNILQKIVDSAQLSRTSAVLEIGPGLGHLTQELAETGAQIAAVEVDRDLVSSLNDKFSNVPNVKILEGDVLTLPPAAWLEQALLPPPYVVVANIPYYITSAILRYLLDSETPPTRIIVMVQKEVARQVVATAPDGNLLGTSVQYYGTPRVLFSVPAGAFNPRPQVDSAVIRIEVSPFRREQDSAIFFQVVRAGFGAKRKQLRNSLANGLHISADLAAKKLAEAGIDSSRRAETLTMEEWERLVSKFTGGLEFTLSDAR